MTGDSQLADLLSDGLVETESDQPISIDRGPDLGRQEIVEPSIYRAPMLWVIGLGVALIVSVILAVWFGSSDISFGKVWQVIGHHAFKRPAEISWTEPQDAIVWQVRLPRVLLGVVVGALLAISGVALQALVRNILAEPYLIGVSSGASVGAATVILFGGVLTQRLFMSPLTLTGAAFIGGLVATVSVFALARIGGTVTPTRLVLAGITMSYALSAVTSTMIFVADSRDGARGVLFWMLGSLDGARWSALSVPAILLILGFVALLWWGPYLDVLALGDDTALALGVDPARLRSVVFTVVALCVAGAVAAAGPIGFVGLVVPHVTRLLVGATHRAVLPVAALLGGLVLVWADVVARVALAPRELPIGVVTALVGAPFLLILVRRFNGAET